MAQVIKRSNTNPWGQAFGIIGQGLNGFTRGAMAAKQLNMMKDYNALLAQQFGRNGEKIQPPIAGATQQPTSAAQPSTAQPSAQDGTGVSPGTSSPLSMEDLMAMIYKQPNTYGA